MVINKKMVLTIVSIFLIIIIFWILHFLNNFRINSILRRDNNFNVVRKYSNISLVPLKIDLDGDVYNGVILRNILCENSEDSGQSIRIDSNNNIYISGDGGNSRDVHGSYILKLDCTLNLVNSYGNRGVVFFNTYLAPEMEIDSSGNLYIPLINNIGARLLKLNSNGNLDNSFGNKGMTVLDKKIVFLDNIYRSGDVYHLNSYNIKGIVIDSIGDICITGNIFYDKDFVIYTDTFIIKMDSGGNIVSSFGKEGKVYFNNVNVTGIAIDRNDNIYIMGSSNEDTFVIKMDSGGNIVSSFGKEGKVYFNNVDVTGIAIDKNDNIYIMGSSNKNIFVIKMDSNGNLVNNFGKKGKVVINREIIEPKIAINSDGDLYIAGEFIKQKEQHEVKFGKEKTDLYVEKLLREVCVVKLNNSGQLATEFGKKGIIIFPSISGGNTGNESANGIAIDSNDNVYITGSSSNGSDIDLFVVKIE